jgi:hypothetical protein
MSKEPVELEDLGPCCACGRDKPDALKDLPTVWARNIVMLEFKALTPGYGWGCFVCGLAMEGAVACLCDDCMTIGRPIRFAVDGEVRLKKRIMIERLTVPHLHDMTKHAGEGSP